MNSNRVYSIQVFVKNSVPLPSGSADRDVGGNMGRAASRPGSGRRVPVARASRGGDF